MKSMSMHLLTSTLRDLDLWGAVPAQTQAMGMMGKSFQFKSQYEYF